MKFQVSKGKFSNQRVRRCLALALAIWVISACGSSGSDTSNDSVTLTNPEPPSPPASDNNQNDNAVPTPGDVSALITPVNQFEVDTGLASSPAISVSLQAPESESIADNLQGVASVTMALGELSGQQFTLDIDIAQSTEMTYCTLNEQAMGRTETGLFQSQVKPTYLNEYYQLVCSDATNSDLDGINKVIKLSSTKMDLLNLFQLTLDRLPDYGVGRSNGENVRRRQRNYYYEINNLLTLAEIYSAPETFGIASDDPVINKIENYMIITSEFYFQPCFDYDFYNGDPASCRSLFKEDGYYLWRSPLNNTAAFRTSHYKVEWRSAAGVAQAIKAIMLKHEDDADLCLVNDLPTMVRDQGMACRAKNLRRMIATHVWEKWQDKIADTDVMHYVAWLELIVDMFNATAHIPHNYECDNDCYQQTTKNSLMGRMLDYVTIDAGYLNITCRPASENNQSCAWREFELGHANSNDLSHLAIPMYVFDKTGATQICQTNTETCFTREALLKTLKERTWAPSVEDSTAVNFPKFDMFLNGYCRDNFNNGSSPLQDYCQQYWVTETSLNNAHREIFGFVNFGSYDAELMTLLLQAADVNKDTVIDENDVLSRGYAAFLYRSLWQPR